MAELYVMAAQREGWNLALAKLVLSRSSEGQISGYIECEERGYRFWMWSEAKGLLLPVPLELEGYAVAWDADRGTFVYRDENGVVVLVMDPVAATISTVPTPTPENWAYLPNVEHVKFAGYTQEQLQILKEAADMVKQYDPERFALFEKEIAWVVNTPEGRCGEYGACYSDSTIYCEVPGCPNALSRERRSLALATSIWGHEFQHHIQHMEGRDTLSCREIEIEAFRAEKQLAEKLKVALTQEEQVQVDHIIKGLDAIIAWKIPHPVCVTEPEPQVQSDFTATFENIHQCGSLNYAIFRLQNTGSVVLDVERLRIENLSSGGDLYGPSYSDVPFVADPSSCQPGFDTLAVGATAYTAANIGTPPSGTQARAHITLCTQEWGVDCTTRTVDFTVP